MWQQMQFQTFLIVLLALIIIQFITSGSAKLSVVFCDYGSYDLPTDVIPTHYDIWIQPSMEKNTYTGEVAIKVNVSKFDTIELVQGKWQGFKKKLCLQSNVAGAGADDRNQIVLHADPSVNITWATFTTFSTKKPENNNANGKEIRVMSICRDRTHKLVVVSLEKNLKSGSNGVLKLRFDAPIRDDMRGIYKSTYKQGRVVKDYLVTQFEPRFARLAFPCFDEPQFKATVALMLTSKLGTNPFAISSTALVSQSTLDSESHFGRNEMRFSNTQPISIHSLAFTMGDYATSEASKYRKLKVRIHTMPNQIGKVKFALNAAVEALNWMEDYTGILYPKKRFEIVVVPDHYSGSTGSFGLATIRDTLALVDRDTSPDMKFVVAANVIKVVVQQWFGNIITCDKWVNFWTTEGIVAQKTFEILAQLYPQFNSALLIKFWILENVLRSKQYLQIPLESLPNLPRAPDAYEAFSTVEFIRSGSVAQLLSNWFGRDIFETTVKNVIHANVYGKTSIGQFFEAIEHEIGRKANYGVINWIERHGYPLINVYLSKGKVKIFVEDFTTAKNRISTPGPDQRPSDWTFPISILFSDSRENQEVVPISIESTDMKIEVQPPSWFNPLAPGHWLKVDPNPDLSTFYRIRYDRNLLASIKGAIQNKFMNSKNRLHILADSLYLTKIQKMDREEFLELVDSYRAETDDNVLKVYSEVYRLQHLFVIVRPRLDVVKKVLDEHVQGSGSLETLTKTTDLAQWKSRVSIINDQIDNNNQRVIDRALEIFQASSGSVPVEMQMPVYRAVVKSGNQNQNGKLLSILSASTSYDQQLRLVITLANSMDPAILASVWKWMKQSNFRPDVLVSIVSLMRGTSIGRSIVRRYRDDYEDWKLELKPMAIPQLGVY